MKNILVTGAAGFVGSFLCEELIAHGNFVVGVDNFFRGSYENVRQLSDNNFILEKLDMSLVEAIPSLREIIVRYKIEVVFHLAAINGTQYFYDNPFFVLDKNIKITQNLLEALANTSVKYLIYTSSSEVYGDPVIIPTSEKHLISLNAAVDRDSYSASKTIDEFYIRLFSNQHHLDCLILRVFNLYGEKMVGTRYGQVVPEFINRMLHEPQFTILGDGKNTRSFCYIKDATWAMRELMEKNITGLVNLGNDHEITVLALAKRLHKLQNLTFNPKFLPGRPNDHKRRRPDIRYLRSLLPNLRFTDLTSGLKKVIAYYKLITPAALIRTSHNPILKPDTGHAWETSAVFNSGAIYLDNKIHFIYRAITSDGESVFGYASSSNGLNIDERLNKPVYLSKESTEIEALDLELPSGFSYQSGNSSSGCEDPRLTQVGDTVYMTYTGFDSRHPPCVELTSISVADFLKKQWNWKKPIRISPPNEMHKNWVIFPEKINGLYAVLHSLTPHILIEYLDTLNHHSFTIKSCYQPTEKTTRWDNWIRGVGPPPIKTHEGWLILYHAMDCNDPNKYKIGAMLLDLLNPTKVLYRTNYPILEPHAVYENEGYKSGVVYACGAVVINKLLMVYYGAADTVLCVASINLETLLYNIKQGAL
jgi:predicted GH43/DUF377 family glycosyl hydrolase/nucleoside-diphosphate-sugar epimerase